MEPTSLMGHPRHLINIRKKKPHLWLFSPELRPRIRIHLSHVYDYGGRTCFFIKMGDEITGLDAIYSHYKGFIPNSRHYPFTTRPGLASI
jgi:hypothetical protein